LFGRFVCDWQVNYRRHGSGVTLAGRSHYRANPGPHSAMKKNGEAAACLRRQGGTEGGGPQYFVSLRGVQPHRVMQLRANAGYVVFF
jgi:hypothetical protein